MFKKLNKKFWAGFFLAFSLSLVATYLVFTGNLFRNRPVKSYKEEEAVKGGFPELPKPASPAGIYYPQEGNTVNSEIFVVWGSGQGNENQGGLTLYDGSGQTLSTQPVYFHSKESGQTGPFITAVNVYRLKPKTDAGTLELYSLSGKDGSKMVIDKVNIKFR